MNLSGSVSFEFNLLSDCHNAWDIALHIRVEKLPHNDPEVASIYHNMGNLEIARGNLQESRNYFDRAISIWVDGGDASARNLAFTYLCFGRAYMLLGNLAEAMNVTQLAEALFFRTTGGDKRFMAL
jgi:tetratricopeptide (TPR) repeat protein